MTLEELRLRLAAIRRAARQSAYQDAVERGLMITDAHPDGCGFVHDGKPGCDLSRQKQGHREAG
jgi:hypothetical protein